MLITSRTGMKERMAERRRARPDVEALKRLHRAVFCAQTDYIPLLVGVRCPNQPGREEFVSNPAGAVREAAVAFGPRLRAGGDWIPTVNIGWFQNVVVPRLYGAEIVAPAGSEPLCRPRFRALAKALDAGAPAVQGAPVEEMLSVLRAARTALPEGFCLSFPPTSSPFDLAQLLLGEEFLVGAVEEPEQVLRFLFVLTDICIRLTRLVKRELGWADDEYITNRGLFFPGLRLPCDAVVNLSPPQIRSLVLPVLERFGAAFGRLCIHFCTRPSPSAHVLPVLLESPAVAAVDNWQGPEVFIGDDAPARMQSRIAIIADVDLRTTDQMDTFLRREPVRAVPRRGGRGIVLAAGARSVEEAGRMYTQWRERMEALSNLVIW